MWEFVEKKSGTGASGIITFSGLDGDTDKFYRVIGQGAASSTALHEIRFNGATTNTVSSAWYGNGSSWTHGSAVCRYTYASGTEECTLEATIYADKTTADQRIMFTRANLLTAVPRVLVATHLYNDTTTNITSISLNLSANNWTTASQFWLYKIADPAG